MPIRRRCPPVRTFRVESAPSLPASEDETTGVTDDDDIEYAPEVVEKVLKAAEGPFTVFATVQDALRFLDVIDEANAGEDAPEGGLGREAGETPPADE